MQEKLAPLRGMKDLLPEDFSIHQHIEDTAFNIAKLYGYEGFSTPILESVNVFDRTLGETSDVVSKEMYCFETKGGEMVALRPEFTAGVVRAFISNGLRQRLPLKLFSTGPVFRYDRPQKGRQRQFHQLNFEYLGANGPLSDAETIAMAAHILEELGILEKTTLELNSLGCAESRRNYQAALVEYFKKYFDELSDDSKARLEKNPLRILDSKDESDKKIAKGAPLLTEYYTKSAAEYFEQVTAHLDNMQIAYNLNPRLVRGLDYYSHTAFEFITDTLGAQGTVLAGGRYDGLTKIMGEKQEVPAIGFAAGIERIALMSEISPEKTRPIFIIPIGDECTNYAVKTAQVLRKNSLLTQLELDGKVGKRMQNALARGAKFVLFIGQDEVSSESYKLKDLDANTERSVTQEQLIQILQS